MLRKILKFFLSDKKFQEIKKESQKWHFICTNCGFKKSIWDAGGIRYKAKSKHKKTLGKCPSCNKKVWFMMEKLDF